jgi:hypothetical protein
MSRSTANDDRARRRDAKVRHREVQAARLELDKKRAARYVRGLGIVNHERAIMDAVMTALGEDTNA